MASPSPLSGTLARTVLMNFILDADLPPTLSKSLTKKNNTSFLFIKFKFFHAISLYVFKVNTEQKNTKYK